MDITITLTDEQVAALKNRPKTGRELHMERRNQMFARRGQINPPMMRDRMMGKEVMDITPVLSPEEEAKQLVTSFITEELARTSMREAFTKKLDEAKARGLLTKKQQLVGKGK